MIDVKHLTKRYGDFCAVNNISFQVQPGDVLGFLGPNGAGKSTTMKIITCFIPPTSGDVTVGGKSILDDPIGVRRQIGYLPESAPSYGEMTVGEFLQFIAGVRQLDTAERVRRTGEVMELTDLESVSNQLIDTLSKGYRQRVCLAQALLHDPPVLILDEPTDGLDPNQKHDMRLLIRRMSERKTIILSTHILEEMEAVCNRAIIIANGNIVADTTPEELATRSRYHNVVTVRTSVGGLEALLGDLRGMAGVAEVQEELGADGHTATFHIFPRGNALITKDVTALLDQRGIAVQELFVQRGRVDEVFRDVTLAQPHG